ncbi:hypothetical protein [uncultured Cohaesibacter sp.]|uniref:hypothetical protein n=1 Tax=uncultured Cohaesibacter sp. TaxID=1002546 RepID=UPI002930388C|nr:hypothetical protein [uncultured Cohaesibacter sp.]
MAKQKQPQMLKLLNLPQKKKKQNSLAKPSGSLAAAMFLQHSEGPTIVGPFSYHFRPFQASEYGSPILFFAAHCRQESSKKRQKKMSLLIAVNCQMDASKVVSAVARLKTQKDT